MELCLYSPGRGYYSAGTQKFGAAGDFVTAPEISTLFGRCLAQTCSGVLAELGGRHPGIRASTGKLARRCWRSWNGSAGYRALPDPETSAELRARRRKSCARRRRSRRVDWLDALPEAGFRGVLLANGAGCHAGGTLGGTAPASNDCMSMHRGWL
jgi:SAM-dependent MidA family methyltransferase